MSNRDKKAAAKKKTREVKAKAARTRGLGEVPQTQREKADGKADRLHIWNHNKATVLGYVVVAALKERVDVTEMVGIVVDLNDPIGMKIAQAVKGPADIDLDAHVVECKRTAIAPTLVFAISREGAAEGMASHNPAIAEELISPQADTVYCAVVAGKGTTLIGLHRDEMPGAVN